MLQPYLRAVDDQGETALVYLNGVFSHAMRKTAVLTGPDIGVDRRFQPARGLTLHSHRPIPRELAAAERVLDSVSWARNQLLYARVDLISDGDKDPILMELELTEPQLYFDASPTATDRMTAIIEEQATAAAIGSRPPNDTGAWPNMGRGPSQFDYRADDRICYGTGQIVPSTEVPAAAGRILARDEVAYVHVRSALNNCYQCRIDRMSRPQAAGISDPLQA